jgi:cation transport ATPase
MELSIRSALFAAGAFLLLIGIASELAYLGSQTQDSGLVESFSSGFNAAAFSLFSGVLIGVGVSLATDSAIARLKNPHARFAFLSILAATALVVAAVSFFQSGEPQVLFLLIFFASCSAFLAFLFSMGVIAVCEIGKWATADKPAAAQTPQKKAKRGS